MLAYASDVGCTPSDRVETIPARTCADAACVNRTAGVRCCSLAGDACSSHCYGLSRNKCRTFSCLMTLQDAIEECAAQGQRLCERDEMCVAASRPFSFCSFTRLANSSTYESARISAGGASVATMVGGAALSTGSIRGRRCQRRCRRCRHPWLPSPQALYGSILKATTCARTRRDFTWSQAGRMELQSFTCMAPTAITAGDAASGLTRISLDIPAIFVERRDRLHGLCGPMLMHLPIAARACAGGSTACARSSTCTRRSTC